MNMGDRIRICLKQQDMNMKELSNKADIPLSTLSDLMNGKTKKLDIQKAKDISIVLQCSLDYLIDADPLDGIGDELKQIRECHGYTLELLSHETKIPVKNLQIFEDSTEPINYFLLSKMCEVYGISVNQFYVDTEIYDEFIPPWFNGDVDKYEAFKKAVDEDVRKERQFILERLPLDKQQELEEALNAGFMIISDQKEQNLIKKYRTLNERGKETVNVVLDNYVALSQPSVKDEVG